MSLTPWMTFLRPSPIRWPTLSVSICKTLKNQVHGLAGEQNKENMPSMVRLKHFSTKSKKWKSPLNQMTLLCFKMKACREDNYPIVATFVRAGYRWTPFPFEAFLKGFEASRWSRTNSHKKPMSIWTTRSTSCTSSGLWPSTGQNQDPSDSLSLSDLPT